METCNFSLGSDFDEFVNIPASGHDDREVVNCVFKA